MYLCVCANTYAGESGEQEAFREKLSGRLPLPGVRSQIQNIKRAITVIRRTGCLPASAAFSLLPHAGCPGAMCAWRRKGLRLVQEGLL